ncbi:hypothetical protein B9Z19DRAFT_1065391 [Tuber borchii]|uniref:Uncharacterized protein n=1 Tax=Tuber borchii TaxID=42251 RepID=A0A2T6ZR92_TUBBO|nr:hypothetical protein B9Z19DRAFT_1065391 [Tuber borchii]
MCQKSLERSRSLTVSLSPIEVSNELFVLIPIQDTSIDKTTMSSPKPPVLADRQPVLHAEAIQDLPQTPPRVHTPGEFPPELIEEVIHVHPPPLPPTPRPQEEIYAARPWPTNAGKYPSTRFRDENFSQLAIGSPTYQPTPYHAYHTSSPTEPATYREAIAGTHREEWKEAIAEELTSLYDNNTWWEKCSEVG